MFGSRFGVVPNNPIKEEYRNPPEAVRPLPAQRERVESYYLEQLPNNKQAQKALQLQEVESAKRKVDVEFEKGFTEYLLGRMGDEETRLPGDKSPYTRTPGWGERNRSLMGNDEVRQYIMNRQNARNEFDRYLNVLRQFRTAIGYDPQTGAYWPPGVFEHYLYYKYILRAPSDDVFSSHDFLNDFQIWKTGNTTRAREGIHQLLPGLDITDDVKKGPAPMPTSVDNNNLIRSGVRIDDEGVANVNTTLVAPPGRRRVPPPPPPLPPRRVPPPPPLPPIHSQSYKPPEPGKTLAAIGGETTIPGVDDIATQREVMVNRVRPFESTPEGQAFINELLAESQSNTDIMANWSEQEKKAHLLAWFDFVTNVLAPTFETAPDKKEFVKTTIHDFFDDWYRKYMTKTRAHFPIQ